MTWLLVVIAICVVLCTFLLFVATAAIVDISKRTNEAVIHLYQIKTNLQGR